jgi:hypothetical protein
LSERVRLVIACGLFVHRREAQQLESVGIGLGARYHAHFEERDGMLLAWEGMGGVGLCSVRNAKTLRPRICIFAC